MSDSSLSPILSLLKDAQIIKQGAEAKVYKLPPLFPTPSITYPTSHSQPPPVASSSGPSVPLLIKHRFPKTYRHPTLSASLTLSRLTAEVRSLLRALKAGLTVPKVWVVSGQDGVVGMEWVEGWSLREVLGGGAEDEGMVDELDSEDEEEEEEGEEDQGKQKTEAEEVMEKLGITQSYLMKSIGTSLAKMHEAHIIHGDLTTSNMMLRLTPTSSPGWEIVLIDFGLSQISHLPENIAVDLYVLERALSSTHEGGEGMMVEIMEAYGREMDKKHWKMVKERLDEVRLRGRKRDMTG